MSGRRFFTNRYQELGWEYEDVKPRQAIRVNTMNAGKMATLLDRLSSIGMRLKRIPFLENGFWVDRPKFSVGATPEYLLGLYSIQEAAAQIPVTLFTQLEGKKVLDACAAPGGKTVQLADIMRGSGLIVALDVKKRRLMALSNQLERCRVKNAVVYHLDARKISQFQTNFDRILLDMPCSGNFSVDRNWFARRTIEDVKRNAARQREILSATIRALESDGEIIYATCSLEPEENELNIHWAIQNFPVQVESINCHGQEGLTKVFGKHLDSSVSKCRRIWPGLTQGFFACKLKRRSAS